MRPITLLATAALVASLSTATAAQEKMAGGLGQACKTELQSLCAGGNTGPFVCLTKNQDKLGVECAAYVKAAGERRAKFQAACDGDRMKLCSGTESKGGQVMQCLNAKKAELSPACAEAVSALPKQANTQ